MGWRAATRGPDHFRQTQRERKKNRYPLSTPQHAERPETADVVINDGRIVSVGLDVVVLKMRQGPSTLVSPTLKGYSAQFTEPEMADFAISNSDIMKNVTEVVDRVARPNSLSEPAHRQKVLVAPELDIRVRG